MVWIFLHHIVIYDKREQISCSVTVNLAKRTNKHLVHQKEIHMKKVKRFLTTMLITSLFCLPLSVCAQEATTEELPSQEALDAQAAGDEIEPQSAGAIIATGTTTIYNGSGTLKVTLTSGNWWADIAAGIAYTERSGVVNCTVKTPSGEVISLGSISGSGSSTGSKQITYAPAGDYLFYFSSAISTPYKVVAYIYD